MLLLMRESEFQASVVRLAQALGWKVYHTKNSRRSAPGFPDLVLSRERIIYAECKTEVGKLSQDQKDWLDSLGGAGGEVYVWRPRCMADIEDILSRRG